MDTINATQEEEHIKALEGKEAVEKIKELTKKADTCFFITNIKTGLPVSARPMSTQQVDDEGNLWFLSVKDSDHNKEIASDPFVHLFYQASAHSGFVNIYGIAEISYDKAKIDELWDPIAKVWFQGGKDDPLISVIKVNPLKGYYWDNKHGNVVAFIKMAASLVTGKTMDDSIEGTLEV
ncbi:pyridoxamine 5'-phosphate oxidase family protein [Mucilaginibacter paludis]|uniref:Pyridoxamine 5'-phosphate oxidase-related FMN-binding protein n=1 Tax=Mucilaginibacter paludis DSM 18603 TaxID=714943 RepID=H1Y9L3_9SPHI|nr:pyridoxamine 5'-phosphate oxidase family protein [Mucilaginibacter paludis]EHQ30515.1 pyridoxamine 5'-phosphate oxidase-related FMN-binding protein [Mucilaginibacter paludis DSM 18603]